MTILPAQHGLTRADAQLRDQRQGLHLYLYTDTDRMEALIDATFSVAIDLGGPKTVEIPAGTFTDFASTPRVIWGIIAPAGRHSKAAIVHDYLYTFRLGTRAQIDRVFRELMRHDGVGAVRRWVMWAAVRLFGGRHFGLEPRAAIP